MSARRLRLIAAVAAVVGIVAVVGAGLLLAGGGDRREAGGGGSATGERPKAGAPAPKLRGTDPITGKRVALADFAGKPVVINIWASWCPGCIAEAADLRRFAADHPEAVVLGIDYQDTVAGARAFYADWGWEHPSIFDADGALAARLGLFGLPSTIFLNSEHHEVTRIVGETDFEGFSGGLEQAKAAN